MALVWGFRKMKILCKKLPVRLLPASPCRGVGAVLALCLLSCPPVGEGVSRALVCSGQPAEPDPRTVSCLEASRNPQMSTSPCGLRPRSPTSSECWCPLTSPPPRSPLPSWDGAPTRLHTPGISYVRLDLFLPRAFMSRVDESNQLAGAAEALWLSNHFSEAGLPGRFSWVTN